MDAMGTQTGCSADRGHMARADRGRVGSLLLQEIEAIGEGLPERL